MVTHDTVDITIELDGREVRLTEIPVTITREGDPGVRTCPNGDPGVPPYDEVLVDINLSSRDIILLIKEAIAEAHGTVGMAADFHSRQSQVLDEVERAVAEAAARRT